MELTRRNLLVLFAGGATAGIGLTRGTAGGAQNASPTVAASPGASPAASPAASPTAGAATEVTIESVDIAFNPKEVTVAANTDVTINLPNNGAALHSFVIDDHKNDNLPFDPIRVEIQPGATETVTVNAPAGDYYYYCDIPGHEAAGMFGTMHVVAQ